MYIHHRTLGIIDLDTRVRACLYDSETTDGVLWLRFIFIPSEYPPN